MVPKYLYVFTALFSLLAIIFMAISVGTSMWEIIRYSVQDIIQCAESKGYNVTVENSSSSYMILQEGEGTYGVPLERFSALWLTCDNIEDDVRAALKRDAVDIPEQCNNFVRILQEITAEEEDSVEMAIRLTRSALSCAIVAALAIAIGCPIGIIALVKQLVIIIMITGVCFLAAGTYIMFTAILMLLRIQPLSTYSEKNMPDFLPSCRRIDIGYSQILAWIAFLSCIAAGVMWIYISLKLRKYRVSIMYSP